MKIASVAEVKSKFSEYIAETKKEAVIITKNGKPTAAIISIDSEEDLERIILNHSKIFNKILEKSKKSQLLSSDEFWKRAWQSN